MLYNENASQTRDLYCQLSDLTTKWERTDVPMDKQKAWSHPVTEKCPCKGKGMWVHQSSVVHDKMVCSLCTWCLCKTQALLSELFSGKKPSWGVLWMICYIFRVGFVGFVLVCVFWWNMEIWFCGNWIGNTNLFCVTK